MAKTGVTAPTPDDRPGPDARERAAMSRAARRYAGRPEPLALRSQAGRADTLAPGGRHNDRAGHLLHTLDTFGTASPEFAQHQLGRVVSVMRQPGETLPDDVALNAGLGAVSGIAPEDEVEAMLAVQMVGVHEVAMDMLTRAKLAKDITHLERYGALATKLLRTFAAQTEALARLRRKGAQTVRVEHVHVHPGGQAVVGNVTTAAPGGGGRTEDVHQPHAPAGGAARALGTDPAMRCTDAGRAALPVPGGDGQGAVQDARRRPRERRSRG